ncbi:hypothetical protein ACFE04_020415 [Oxalis oulophora]
MGLFSSNWPRYLYDDGPQIGLDVSQLLPLFFFLLLVSKKKRVCLTDDGSSISKDSSESASDQSSEPIVAINVYQAESHRSFEVELLFLDYLLDGCSEMEDVNRTRKCSTPPISSMLIRITVLVKQIEKEGDKKLINPEEAERAKRRALFCVFITCFDMLLSTLAVDLEHVLVPK